MNSKNNSPILNYYPNIDKIIEIEYHNLIFNPKKKILYHKKMNTQLSMVGKIKRLFLDVFILIFIKYLQLFIKFHNKLKKN